MSNNKALTPNEWPAGTEGDGRRYYLDWGQNKRNGDPGINDKLMLDEQGDPIFEFVDPHSTELPEALQFEREGSYQEMAKVSYTLNARQDKMGLRAFNFYPTPVQEALAA